MEERRFARSRWTHQGDKFAFINFDVCVFERHDVKFVADELFGQVTCLDYWFAHFCLTLSASFKSAGGFTIKSSPPFRPSSMCTPCGVVAPVFTVRFTARPLATTNTEPLRTADIGITIDGFAISPRCTGLASETNATLAFISGRRYWSG